MKAAIAIAADATTRVNPGVSSAGVAPSSPPSWKVSSHDAGSIGSNNEPPSPNSISNAPGVPGEANSKPLLAVIPFNIDVQAVLPIVGELRHSGIRVELEIRGRKIGKAMGWANSIGADYTYVVGPRDLEQGSGMLKSLTTGEQTAVALSAQAISEKL